MISRKPFCILFFVFFALPAFTAKKLMTGEEVSNRTKGEIRNLNTKELAAMLKKNPDTFVIDVRLREEVLNLGGMIDGINSINIQRGWLEFRIGDYFVKKDDPIIVYCGLNLRSPLAAKTLMEMGYANVYNYEDGFFEWRKAGLPVYEPDKAPDSLLYDKPREVIDGVWSAIGAPAPAEYGNSGHNNNLSFIVTSEGVVVINAGAGYLLAAALHDEIKKITDQPVRSVVLENAQGHAMLGGKYWKEQGAEIIAHAEAREEIEARGDEVLERAKHYLQDKAHRTEVTLPDKTFEENLVLEMGGQRIELLYLGPAHSPGDIVVWLPQKKLVITGDLAFHQRLLPVFEHTDTEGWIETWDELEALGATRVIPGHGEPTNMKEVTKYTKDYLVYLRGEIEVLIDEGGELQDAGNIDQSAYRHLKTFRELARLNASRIFRDMEF